MHGQEIKVKSKKPLLRKILIVHGPNLNLLGKREKNIYGVKSLQSINNELREMAKAHNYETISYQSNSEGKLISKIQNLSGKIAGLLINPAAYTHTSVALRDTLLSTDIPKIEVHLSNIYKRESFRHHSLISDVVDGQVMGFGWMSYRLGLEALLHSISTRRVPSC